MNNIEILENLTNHIRFNEPLHYGIGLYIQALENLIKENKELKEKNLELLTRLRADGLIERDKYWISKIKEALYNGTLDAKGWGCEDGAYCVEEQFKYLLEEGE